MGWLWTCQVEGPGISDLGRRAVDSPWSLFWVLGPVVPYSPCPQAHLWLWHTVKLSMLSAWLLKEIPWRTDCDIFLQVNSHLLKILLYEQEIRSPRGQTLYRYFPFTSLCWHEGKIRPFIHWFVHSYLHFPTQSHLLFFHACIYTCVYSVSSSHPSVSTYPVLELHWF